MKKAVPERRNSPLRRQFNEAFCDPDGRVSVSKTIAVFSQIAVLFHMGKSFDLLIDKPETLAVILTFLVAPDALKKWLSLRYAKP